MDPAVEGWREILQPQLLDLTLFAAFITLALISFFRKSVALKYVTFVAAVGYMGFTKSSLVSVSDVFRLTDLSVPEFKYSLVWYAFMAFVVVTTVLWGRVYWLGVAPFHRFVFPSLLEGLRRDVESDGARDSPHVARRRAAFAARATRRP